MTPERHALDVWLGDRLVGRIAILPEKSGRCDFRFHADYRARYPRPVLGQAFEEDLRTSYFHRTRLPSFFANLLPEGGLRAIAERQIGRRHRHEIHLLALLGEDLPGAVRAAPPDAEGPDSPGGGREERELPPDLPRLRFALSGVQMKMSVLRGSGQRLTIPASGLGGDWIVKFTHSDLLDLPANEHAMMTWARLSGIETPEVELVPVESISGLPAAFHDLGSTVFAIPRFDRLPGGGRVHMEDFAQVLSCYPEDKYDGLSYERLAALAGEIAGREGLSEIARRLVFVVASGNGDAHMKNWSLLYPDGVTPRLSPAYDLVSTIRYPRFDDQMALPLHRSVEWSDVSVESFERIADDCRVSRAWMRAVVDEAITRIAASARDAQDRSSWADEAWIRIAEHWKRVPLFAGRSL